MERNRRGEMSERLEQWKRERVEEETVFGGELEELCGEEELGRKVVCGARFVECEEQAAVGENREVFSEDGVSSTPFFLSIWSSCCFTFRDLSFGIVMSVFNHAWSNCCCCCLSLIYLSFRIDTSIFNKSCIFGLTFAFH